MGLVLQETSIQVKYWNHTSLTKKQVKEVLFIKTRQKSRQNPFYWDLMLKLDTSCICRELRNQTFQIWLHAYSYVFVQGFFSHNPRHI